MWLVILMSHRKRSVFFLSFQYIISVYEKKRKYIRLRASVVDIIHTFTSANPGWVHLSIRYRFFICETYFPRPIAFTAAKIKGFVKQNKS